MNPEFLRKVDETTAAGCLPPAILLQSLWNTVFDTYHSDLILWTPQVQATL